MSEIGEIMRFGVAIVCIVVIGILIPALVIFMGEETKGKDAVKGKPDDDDVYGFDGLDL